MRYDANYPFIKIRVVGRRTVWYKARAQEAINPHVHRHIALGAPPEKGLRMGCSEA